MTERTERHTASPTHGLAGEGHEGMPGRHSVSYFQVSYLYSPFAAMMPVILV